MLVDSFLGNRMLAGAAPARAKLEGELASQLAVARAAWPGVAVPDEDVLALWGAALSTADSFEAASRALETLPIADLLIAAACGRGEPAALRAFEARYFPGIAPALARVSPDAAFIDEVKQIVREKLFVASPGGKPKILELAGKGELGGLVRVIALRTALNMRRSQQKVDLVDDNTMLDVLVSDADPKLHALKRQQKDLVKRAFEGAIAALEARDRNLLRMYLLHSLGIDELGRAHGVHRATAARWLERIREELRKSTVVALREQLRLDATEIESLIGAAESSLQISFQRVLAS